MHTPPRPPELVRRPSSSSIEPLEARIAPAFSAVVNLSDLNGANGFEIMGAAAGDRAGYSVSSAGDVNGDGLDDVLIGAYGAASGADEGAGASFVVFGKRDGFSGTLDLAALNGSNGFRITGVAEYDYSGSAVSSAGDVNGDGFGDLLIGAPNVQSGGLADNGAAYVVFGKSSFPAELKLSSLDGANGFRITGEAEYDYAGSAVSSAGDVNGDGFDDVLIGAPGASVNGVEYTGAAFVVFGKAQTFPATLKLSTLTAGEGFRVSGAAAEDGLGSAVSAAGDVNGDGFDDVVIGAYAADPNGSLSGASYVVFGTDAAFAISLNVATLNGGNGFALRGAAAGDEFGAVVSGGNDINGDGFADLLIGAPGVDGNGAESGASYVVFGKNGGFSAALEVSTLNGVTGFRILGEAAGDGAGGSVSAVGDVDADGFADVLIGAQGADANGRIDSGVSYLVFGRATGFGSTLQLSSLNGLNGFQIDGEAIGNGSGAAVGAAGDLNGDGFADLLIGAPAVSSNGRPGAGAGYVVFGKDSDPALSVTDGTVREGDSGTTAVSFVVSLDIPSTRPITVEIATAEGSAVGGSDFTVLPQTSLRFAPGETSKTVLVEVHGDTAVEVHETFSLLLSAATNAVINDSEGVGTILNDDTAVRIADSSRLEGDSGAAGMSFTVTLEQPTVLPVSVSFRTADGSAMSGSDYESTSGTVQFAPGEMRKEITVQVKGDTATEPDETFSLTLANPSNATIADGTAAGVILTDDTLLTISNAAVLEGHSGTRTLSFDVALSSPQTEPVTVNFATSGGTAIAGSDYSPTSGVLFFAPGTVSQSFNVVVSGDVIPEATESFNVVLSAPTNAIVSGGPGVGTILNDDVQIVSGRKATFTDVDGDLVVIRVTRGQINGEDFTLFPSGVGSQLALVDFSGDSVLTGAALKIKAKPDGPGDGHVNVGYINAQGVNLLSVDVRGDLGRVDAGSHLRRSVAVGTLWAQSLGALGVATQLPGGSLQSNLVGTLQALQLSEGITDAQLFVTKSIGTVNIEGSVVGGTLHSDRRIGSVAIGGDLLGTPDRTAGISALGIILPGDDARATAIARVKVKGNVSGAQILGGYDRAGSGANPDARIGLVKVVGDWIGSDLVASTRAGADGFFGNADDVLIPGGDSTIAAIGRLVIKGQVLGSAAPGDHFGVVAEEIGRIKIGGIVRPLDPGPRNDLQGVALGGTDVRAREV